MTVDTVDPEVVRAAEFLASHALLLFGLGILVLAASVVSIVFAVRMWGRYQGRVRSALTTLTRRAADIEGVSWFLSRSGNIVPSGYLLFLLALGLALTAALTAFVVIAEEVVGGGDLAAFDQAFSRALQRATTPRWRTVFQIVSWLGTTEVLAVASVTVAAGLLLRTRTVLAIGWSVGQAGGGLLNFTLKQAFERARPESADPILAASSWSFPSGHAMGTFIFCGLGAYLLLRGVRSWTTTVVVVTVSLLWCLVMGFSRLYLGAHFASDVVAGLAAGAVWVAICVSAIEVAQKQRARTARRATPGR